MAMSLSRAIVIAAAGAAAFIGAPTVALAQNAYVPEQCQQRVNNNGLAGGVIGGVVGAAAGRSIAGRGNRSEGQILGALAGALVGNQIGRRRVACDDGAYRGQASTGGGGYRGSVYDQGYGYDPRYPSHQASWGQGAYGAPQPQACGWGEAQLRRPDGRFETRQVWMCQQPNGEWVVAQ